MKLSLLFLALVAVGCGTRTELSLDDATTDDATFDVVERIDAATEDAPTFETSPRCAKIADALAEKIVPATGACTTVVHLDASARILGYRFFCGPYASIMQDEARKKSIAESGLFGAGCIATPSASGPTPKDDFVFYQAPTAAKCACCGDGWFTALGARNAMTLAAGTIAIGGDKKGLVFPKTWDPSSDLDGLCASSIPRPTLRGYDLRAVVGDIKSPPGVLDASEMEPPMRAVWNTALPDAWAKKQYLFDGVVLKYSPKVDAPDFEWLVLINTGWLE